MSIISKDTESNLIKVGGAHVDRDLINTFKKLREGKVESEDESESENIPPVDSVNSNFNPLSWLSSLGISVAGQLTAPKVDEKVHHIDEDVNMDDEALTEDFSTIECFFEEDLPTDWMTTASLKPFWKTEDDAVLQEKLKERRELILEASKKIHKAANRMQSRRFVGVNNKQK